jgi:hypothetical protein
LKSLRGQSRRVDCAGKTPICSEAAARHDNDSTATAMVLETRRAITGMGRFGYSAVGDGGWKLKPFRSFGVAYATTAGGRKGNKRTVKEWK